MMKYLIVILALGSVTTFAKDDPKYANPVNLYMQCDLATIMGNTNNSWGITIKGLEIAFWDNSNWSMGRYEGVVFDQTFGDTTDPGYGNGHFFKYVGPKGDQWSLTVGPTYLMENNKTANPHVYGILQVPGGGMKDQILECKTITREEAEDTFETARME